MAIVEWQQQYAGIAPGFTWALLLLCMQVYIIDPTLLEAFACREALALAEDLGIQMMHVASDCEEVVKDIKQGSGGYHGAIIQEIIARKNDMISCTFTHERRVFNFEAHNLAKFGCNLGVGRHVWLGSPHDQNIVPLIIEQ